MGAVLWTPSGYLLLCSYRYAYLGRFSVTAFSCLTLVAFRVRLRVLLKYTTPRSMQMPLAPIEEPREDGDGSASSLPSSLRPETRAHGGHWYTPVLAFHCPRGGRPRALTLSRVRLASCIGCLLRVPTHTAQVTRPHIRALSP